MRSTIERSQVASSVEEEKEMEVGKTGLRNVWNSALLCVHV